MVLVIGVAYVLAICVPAGLICRRIGRPAWLDALAIVPLVNIGLLWFVAVSPWGNEGTINPPGSSPSDWPTKKYVE
ncbi:MAG TPA: hypothetical protein VGF40_12300 [Thermoanaerobaculia bacterium]